MNRFHHKGLGGAVQWPLSHPPCGVPHATEIVKSSTHFAIETAGSMDLDAELKIWVSGQSLPMTKQFNKQLNIYALQSLLATYVLR